MEQLQLSEENRQRKYEDQILVKILGVWGVSGVRILTLRKKKSFGGDETFLTCSWFNEASGFPVKLSIVRFSTQLTLAAEVKNLFGTPRSMNNSRLVRGIRDWDESYPESQAAIITRFPDWGKNGVFHTNPYSLKVNGDAGVSRMHEGVTFVLQELDSWLRDMRAADIWQFGNFLSM